MDKIITVLVVDDDRDVLETLQAVLSTRGFSVKVADEVLDIQQKIVEFKPDVILLDVGFKNAHGGDVCRQLKQEGIAKQIPIVLFSGDKSIKDEYKNFLADDFIEKPVRINNLVATLKSSAQLF